MALPSELRDAIARDFPADFLSDDAGDRAEYGRDWTKVFAPDPSAIAFPRTTDEVSRLMALASAHRVPVVPSGGRTGLAGGAVAARGELVVSLARMRRMDPVDELGATVRVQAGAITEAVHRHAAERGLTWPVDFASKGSSQVGGNIATNAGGVRVIRYGLTRQWVLGLEVVLASGAVLELNGALEKNNTGFDLRQLFIGSEGTLGIITEATLKLTRLPARSDVLLVAVAGLDGVLRLFREARRAPLTLAAFEFFTDRCLERVLRHRKLRAVTAPATHYVLIEIEGGDAEALQAWLESLVERDLVSDGTLAQSAAQAAELWALREGISESLSATGFPHKNDVALPLAALEAFCAELEAVFAREYPGWEICLFGHIGDGNLHVNVMKPDDLDRPAFQARTAAADRDLFTLVRKHHGSISAEHGIGLLKKPYLAYSRSPDELEVLRAVKRALDPLGLLNPGKIFD
ncbi:MAG TPA: FAD-binding oxidoreductase [Polyangia bacterium]|nr:FAD-binding oxidoreductase [Polyangia bacterium]